MNPQDTPSQPIYGISDKHILFQGNSDSNLKELLHNFSLFRLLPVLSPHTIHRQGISEMHLLTHTYRGLWQHICQMSESSGHACVSLGIHIDWCINMNTVFFIHKASFNMHGKSTTITCFVDTKHLVAAGFSAYHYHLCFGTSICGQFQLHQNDHSLGGGGVHIDLCINYMNTWSYIHIMFHWITVNMWYIKYYVYYSIFILKIVLYIWINIK